MKAHTTTPAAQAMMTSSSRGAFAATHGPDSMPVASGSNHVESAGRRSGVHLIVEAADGRAVADEVR
jgi:hypothetical protein